MKWSKLASNDSSTKHLTSPLCYISNRTNPFPNSTLLYKTLHCMPFHTKLNSLQANYLSFISPQNTQMDSGRSGDSTVITMPESKSNVKGKAPAVVLTTSKAAPPPPGRWKKGVAMFDLVLRLGAIGAALGATATMGTTDQTLPFVTQFFQFQAEYDDFPVFMFFVIANAITCAYLVLSLPVAIFCIIRPHAAGPRLLLLICDTVIAALTIGAAAAAVSIVYLAHDGNPSANWLPICQQYGDFCKGTSGAVVGSFIAAFLLICLIVLSGLALGRN